MESQNIINQIFNLKNEDIEQWLKKRLETLEKTATETRTSINPLTAVRKRVELEDDVNANTEFNGFLTKNVEISKDFFSTGFILDDESFYKTIIEYIKKSDENLTRNNTYIMHLVQKTINDYFGVTATEQRRLRVYDSSIKIDEDGFPIKEPFSIEKFKQNNSACCSERGAVAQNILCFLGYDTSMIYGYVLSENSGKNEAHVYNCISLPSGKGMLLDFTNPIFKDGKYYRPSMHSIDSEKMKKFMRGNGQIEVFHKTVRTINGKDEEEFEAWVYGSKIIDKEHFKNKKNNEEIGNKIVVTATDIGKKTKDTPVENKSTAAKMEIKSSEKGDILKSDT